MTFPLLGFDTWLHHSCKWAFLGGSCVLRELDGSPRQLALQELARVLMVPRPLWPSAGGRPFGGGRASRLGGGPRASHQESPHLSGPWFPGFSSKGITGFPQAPSRGEVPVTPLKKWTLARLAWLSD
uniref:Uncharacterized protein n=1 Tax=Myotis myotis TaxID=51298 RepID=A0A7J7TTM2_MYOMY|nr:hypothetical protein mMyoMyo1_008937 [Myotis myotis]